jgi:hypothetical protein
MLLVLAAVMCPEWLFGQRVSFGFVGGANITRDFPVSRSVYQDPSYPAGLTSFDLFSNTHTFIAGFSAEVQIRSGLSLEVNALHRNLNLQRRFILPDGSELQNGSSTVTTWEYPMLLKYRLPTVGAIRPFVEAGPSFRTRHDPAPTEPSQFGATLGAGVEFRAGRIRISPAIRYTRWQYDGDYPLIATKRDQVEFVTGISYATSIAAWKVGSRALRFGLIGGTPLTGGVSPRFPAERIDERQGYIGGLVFELEAYKRLSFEVNGLYRPFRADLVSVGGPAGEPPRESRFEFTIITWQLPLLAKYSFRPQSRISPFVEAGPSFRLSGNLNGSSPSPVGLTAGGGFQTKYGAMKVSPVLRYTRWANDPTPIPGGFLTRPTQVELLVSFTF